MTTTSFDVEASWAALPIPARGQLRAVRSEHPDAWLALDGQQTPHLLVLATAGEADVSIMDTKGLSATYRELELEGARGSDLYLALQCDDEHLRGVFATLVANVISEAMDAPSAEVAARAVLARTRAFWSVDQTGLGAEEAAGLFGELWFAYRWVATPTALRHWRGPARNRHDFAWPSMSVEVKTTRLRGDGPATHRIAHLDQLADPETGPLLLFSLQIAVDELAHNSLPGMVRLIEDAVGADEAMLQEFRDQLADANYSPLHADRYVSKYRVVAESLYSVEEGFPRLTRTTVPGGLPVGVVDVSYAIDLAACEPWKIATRPEDAPLLSTL